MDVVITWEVWEAQKQKLPPSMRPLLALASQDLVVLKDMETSGIRFDREGSLAHAEKLEEQIAEIQASLSLYHSVPCFNWNSNDHLSALLFGGTITEVVKVPDGIYGPKAAKAGQVKYKNQTKEYVLPRLLNPPKGAETAKEGVFSVEENVLKTLSTKKHAKLLDSILEIKKLQKDISTYLRGFPNKQDEGNYSKEYIHGNFNQCITLTGRLSSSKPNLQNPSDNVLRYMVSRYE
jgi:DNA polymerase I-like protein with 3'-5' exonuclease and polymerase domains